MATQGAQSMIIPQQTTSGSGSLSDRKSSFAQSRIPNMKRESDIDQIMRTGSSQSPKEPIMSESGRRSALQANMMRSQKNPPRVPAQTSNTNLKDQLGAETKKQVNIQVALQTAKIKGALSESIGIAPEELKAKGRGKRSLGTILSQIIFRRLIKKMIPKLAKIVANALVSALDLGTGGVSLLVTIFVRVFTLGHSNVEMVYGTWIKKGQDKVIGGVSLFPIPLFFIDKNAYGVQGLIIMQDLILIVVVIIAIAVQALMLLVMFAPYLLIGFGLSYLF